MSLKTAIIILIIVLIVCGLAIYYALNITKEAKVEKLPFASWVEAKEAGDVLNLEITPYKEPTSLYKEWKYLRDYLNEKMSEKAGLKVNLRIARDYRSAINDVGLGVADLAILPSTAFIEARKDYCVQPLVSPKSRQGNRCLLVARKDSLINSISDIKGKSFAYGDEKSLCGSLIVHKWMKENNIVYQGDLRSVQYFSNYDAVLQAIASGDFDVGGVKESVFRKANLSDFKIIAVSDPVPDFVLVSTFDFDKGLSEEIIKTIEEMDLDILTKIDFDYIGWQRVADGDYDSLRKLVKEIHGSDYYLPTADFCQIKPKCKLAAK